MRLAELCPDPRRCTLLRRMSKYPREQVDRILGQLDLPGWVARIRAEPKRDEYDEPAIDVLVVVRSGEREIFSEGGTLNEVARQIHDVLLANGIELWPFVRFVSADEIEAA